MSWYQNTDTSRADAGNRCISKQQEKYQTSTKNNIKMSTATGNESVLEYNRMSRVLTQPVDVNSQCIAWMPPPMMDSRNYGLLLSEGVHNWYVTQGISIMNLMYSALCMGGAMTVKDMGHIITVCDMHGDPLNVEQNIHIMKQADRHAVGMQFDAYYKTCMEQQRLPLPSMLPVRVQCAIEYIVNNPQMYGCVPAVVIPKILYQVFLLTNPPAPMRVSAPENMIVGIPPAHDVPRVQPEPPQPQKQAQLEMPTEPLAHDRSHARKKTPQPEPQNQMDVLIQAAQRVQDDDDAEPVLATPVLTMDNTNPKKRVSPVYTAARRRSTRMKTQKSVRRVKTPPPRVSNYVHVGTWIQQFFCGHESHYENGVRKPQNPYYPSCCKHCRRANSKLANWPLQRINSMDQRSPAFWTAMHNPDLPDPRPPAVSVYACMCLCVGIHSYSSK
jgi:hypothetical protein